MAEGTALRGRALGELDASQAIQHEHEKRATASLFGRQLPSADLRFKHSALLKQAR